MSSVTVLRVWRGREGDGVFARGGTGRVRPLIVKSGGKWNGELRGWVMTLSQYQSLRMVYSKPVEELDWADFQLAEWQGWNPVVSGPFVAPNHRRGPSYRTGGVYPGYQRAGR